MEKVGYYLDNEIQDRYRDYRDQGYAKQDISSLIEEHLDLVGVLSRSSADWDGGYAVAGVVGHGDAFVMRDPWGIRPAYYYKDEEVVVVASEGAVIQTAFRVDDANIREIRPGYALIVKKDGSVREELVREPRQKSSCSFERIYFSRGNDRSIYREPEKVRGVIDASAVESDRG